MAVISVHATVPRRPGKTLSARLTVQSNGNQRFEVPVSLAVQGNAFDFSEPVEFRFQIIRRHRGSRLQRRVVRVDARRERHAPDLESTDRFLVNVERQNGDCYEEDDDGD